MPYDNTSQTANSSWLSNRGQTLVYFRSHLKGIANMSLQCGLALSFYPLWADMGMYTL